MLEQCSKKIEWTASSWQKHSNTSICYFPKIRISWLTLTVSFSPPKVIFCHCHWQDCLLLLQFRWVQFFSFLFLHYFSLIKVLQEFFFSFLRQNYRRIFAVERIARSASRRRCRICSQLSKHKLPFSRKCQLRPRHPIAFGQFGFKQMPNSQKL